METSADFYRDQIEEWQDMVARAFQKRSFKRDDYPVDKIDQDKDYL